MNSLRYKDMLQDIVLLRRDPARSRPSTRTSLRPGSFANCGKNSPTSTSRSRRSRGRFTIDITQPQREFIQAYYSNVLGRVENGGHRFGEDLSDAEKQALIAFLATL